MGKYLVKKYKNFVTFQGAFQMSEISLEIVSM